MISISAVAGAILGLITDCLIFILFFWMIGFCEVPHPYGKAAKEALAILAIFVCVVIVLSLVSGQ